MWDWLHERGYTAFDIPDLTLLELNLTKLGHLVREEQQADAAAAARRGGSTVAAKTKREHYRSIRQRLRQE